MRSRSLTIVILPLLLACSTDPARPANPDATLEARAPAPQDTGHHAERSKAEIQAAVAVAQAQVDAQQQALEQARAEAATTEACKPRDPTPNSGPACSSGTIACGQTIQATTAGGTRQFDGDRYLHSYCFPTTPDSHAGPERVYLFELAADQRATFELRSPCADLDLAVLRWEHTERCPAADENITECEGQNRGGGGVAKVWNNRVAHYLVIVDGNAPEGANFEIEVSCQGG